MYLGIEIGGTKLQLGVGPGDGNLMGLWRGVVDVAAGPEGIRRQITAAAPELLTGSAIDRSGIRGVGIGFGGPVDDATRTIIKSHQIEGWDNFPLAQWIEEMLGWPAVLGNDADVAGLAEALFGAGKGLSPIFYITIGSGIGGGLIINGEIYRGCGRGAAEIGHLRIGVDKIQGVVVPLEMVASGWSIARLAQIEANKGGIDPDTPLFRLVWGKIDLITAEIVGQAASQGDRLCRGVLKAAINSLAEGISQVIALLGPRRIVIGGGVSLMGEEVLFAPLRQTVDLAAFKPFQNCYDIVPAALGEEVVVHGALALARKKLE